MCVIMGVPLKKPILDDFKTLLGIQRDSDDLNHEIMKLVYNFDVVGLLIMEEQRIDIDNQITDLEYLKDLNEDLVWDTYQEVAAQTASQIRPEEISE